MSKNITIAGESILIFNPYMFMLNKFTEVNSEVVQCFSLLLA